MKKSACPTRMHCITLFALGWLLLAGIPRVSFGQITLIVRDPIGSGNVYPDPGTYTYTGPTNIALMGFPMGEPFLFWTTNGVFFTEDRVTNLALTSPGTYVLQGYFGDPSGDLDGDGLSNTWELQYGFDPLDPFGAHGRHGDPDNDGLPNILEYWIGTNDLARSLGMEPNPIHADTDGDGMDDGYEYYHMADINISNRVVGLARNVEAVLRGGSSIYGPYGNPDGDYHWSTNTGYELLERGFLNMEEYSGPDDELPGFWPPVITSGVRKLVFRYEPNPLDTLDQTFSDTTDSEIHTVDPNWGDGFDDGFEYTWDRWQREFTGTDVGDPTGTNMVPPWADTNRVFHPGLIHPPPPRPVPEEGRPDFDLSYHAVTALVLDWYSDAREYTAWAATNVSWAPAGIGLLRLEYPNRRRCTHPFRWDPDADTLPDGFEVAFGYDPWKGDTDDDGVTDGDDNSDGDWYASAGTNVHYNVYLTYRFNPYTAYGYIEHGPERDGLPLSNMTHTVRFTAYQELIGPRGTPALLPYDPDDTATHPRKCDTDTDGIWDGWEWYVGLDANDPTDGPENEDGDGLSNFEEFYSYHTSTNVSAARFYLPSWMNKRRPTDPYDSDTDIDQCDDGRERVDFNFGTNTLVTLNLVVDTNSGVIIYHWFTGGGLDPATVDTDDDYHPDYWEASFAGTQTTNGDFTADGLDGTSGDAHGDPDGDGLANYQEYLAGAVYAWQWAYNNPWPYLGIDGVWDTNYEKPRPPYQGYYNPWDFFDSDLSRTAEQPWGDAMVSAGGREPKWWDPNWWAYIRTLGPWVPFRFITAAEPWRVGLGGAELYSTAFPNTPDTDGDGLDDYYEIFHFMNPLCGDQYDRVMDKIFGQPNLGAIDWGRDLENTPWMSGYAYIDQDQDGLPLIFESIQPDTPYPRYYHTDTSPYWHGDVSHVQSWANVYYWLGPEMGSLGYWYWDGFVLAEGPLVPAAPPAYFFDFEMNEGFDTDNDNYADRAELVDTAASPGSTDPLDCESPLKRRALKLNGNAAARTQGRGWTHAWEDFREFCVEAWVRPDNPRTGIPQVIVERPSFVPNGNPMGYPSGIRLNFRLGLDGEGRPFVGYHGAGYDAIYVEAKAPGEQALAPNLWYHLAGVYDGTNHELTLYINGQVASMTPSAEIPWNGYYGGSPYNTNLSQIAPPTDMPIVVGARENNPEGWIGGVPMPWSPWMYNRGMPMPWPGVLPSRSGPNLDQFFSGHVDEIRIWTGRRTGSEIRQTMNQAFRREDVVNASPRILYAYGFNDLPSPTREGVAPVGFEFLIGYPSDGGYTATPWWAYDPEVNRYYNEYRYVPWIENLAAHLPLDPPADTYIPCNGRYPNTSNPYVYVYRHATRGANEWHPFYDPPPLAENVWGDLLPLRFARADTDTPLWDKGGAPAVDPYDSDGDGMPDDWEYAHGLDPFNATGQNSGTGDPDGDGLSNLYEYLTRTDPQAQDTDGDGLNDADEDYDSDRLGNRFEQGLGTRPDMVDTDDDGVTDWEEFSGSMDPNYDPIRPPTSQAPSGTRTDPLDSLKPTIPRSMYFNGSTRLIVPPSNKLMSEAWTAEMWVRPDISCGDCVLISRHLTGVRGEDAINYEVGLTTNGAPAGMLRPYALYMTQEGIVTRVDGTGATEHYYPKDANLAPIWVPATGAWTHVAATYEPETTTLSIYVNAKLATYRTDASLAPPTVYGYQLDHWGDQVTVGAALSTGPVTRGYRGYLDEVRFWRMARTAEQIADAYNGPSLETVAGTVPLQSGLVLLSEGLSEDITQAQPGSIVHALVEFNGKPTTEDLKAVTDAGGRVVYYVTPTVRTIAATPEQFRNMAAVIQRSTALTARHKISPRLAVQAGGNHVRDALVEFHPDVPQEQATAAVVASGAALLRVDFIGGRYLVVRGTEAQLFALAGHDAPAWLMPVADYLTRPDSRFYSLIEPPMAGGVVAAPYTTVGEGWDGPGQSPANLWYHHVNYTPDVLVNETRTAYRSQLMKWAAVAPLTFNETTAPGMPESLDLSFQAGAAWGLDGPGGMLGYAYFPNDLNPEPLAGDIVLDEDETWSIGPSPAAVNMEYALLHESGHALGLGHSSDTNAVMYPFYDGTRPAQLGEDDILAIQALYGQVALSGLALNLRCDDGGVTAEDFSANRDWWKDWASAAILDGCAWATNYTAPLDKDTDGDGMPDWWELARGLNPTAPTGREGPWGDPDLDGLNNWSEYRAGTDPLDSDSDDDGFGDYDSRAAPNMRTWGEMYDDGDGIPDEWEVSYRGPCPTTGKRGLDPAYYDAHLDSDEDGWSNYAEYMGHYVADTNTGALGRSPDPLDHNQYPQPLLTVHVRYHGMWADDIQALLDGGAPIHLDFYRSPGMDGFPVATLDMTTPTNRTRLMTTGHLVEGTNYVFAYADRDGDGTWNPQTEPAGISAVQPLIGWDDSNDIEIGLTDTQPVRPRYMWPAQDTGPAGYLVEMKQGSALIFSRIIRRRNYLHEGDYAYAGVWGLASNSTPYVCWVYTNQDIFGRGIWITFNQGLLGVQIPPLTAPTVYGHDHTYAYERNIMEWTMDPNSTRYSIDIATDADPATILMTVADQPAPFRDRYGRYQTYIPSSFPAGLLYAGDTYGIGRVWTNGRYWMRLRSGAGPDRVSGNSTWRAFNFDLQTPENGGKSMIKGEVYYFGKVFRGYGDPQTNLVVVIQSFLSNGFSGDPDGQVQVVYVCDTNNPSAKKGDFELMGLHNGVHYVRAFIDVNANRKLDPFEPWGFAKNMLTDTDYEPGAIDLTGSGSVLQQGVRVVVRDRDTDDDNLPDGWEWMYFGTLGYGGYDDPDGDGANNLQEYTESLYDSDPMNPDTDGDSVSDGVEIRITRTDPHDATDYLGINAVEMVAVPGGGKQFVLRWEGKDGVVYGVQYSDDLSVWQTVDQLWMGAGVHEYADPESAEVGRRYYRVIVR